jgi:L-cystine uptake protein TcyP (sodium:dicarboxylate symporter family)
MELIINIFLGILAAYAAFGLLFGLYFLFIGATKIDPLLADSKKGIRVLLFPGVIATWPLFVKKAFQSKTAKS